MSEQREENAARECGAGQVRLEAVRVRNGQRERIIDPTAEEVPLRIVWDDPATGASGAAVLWAWPHEPEPLVLGHVLLDLLPRASSVGKLPGGESCRVHARGRSDLAMEGAHAYRVTLGKPVPVSLSDPPPPASWGAESLLAAMRGFMDAGGHWTDTGCIHRAGVFDPALGRLLARAEDISRHNCLDRLAGWSAATRIPLADKVLTTSARITANYCAKALRAGFRILVGRSAVTTASVALAGEWGATLVGFARTEEGRFTVFADEPGRLAGLG